MSEDLVPVGARLRQTETGPEKYCGGCGEWWPADRDFFDAAPADRGGLISRCKACSKAWRQARRGVVLVEVPPPAPDLVNVPWLTRPPRLESCHA